MPDNREWNHCFNRLASLLERPVTEQENENLQRFVALLLKWNKAYNLIGRSTVEQILDRHIVDCAALLPLLSPDSRIADIGSGAGFPGLVLGILSPPGCQFDLLESNGKKGRFLQYAIHHLNLKNHCQHFLIRAESHFLTYNNIYDVVVSRAVAQVSQLAEWSCHLLRPGGSCLALKGIRVEEEVDDFLSSPIKNCFETPSYCEVADIPGARIVRLRKVSRETSAEGNPL